MFPSAVTTATVRPSGERVTSDISRKPAASFGVRRRPAQQAQAQVRLRRIADAFMRARTNCGWSEQRSSMVVAGHSMLFRCKILAENRIVHQQMRPHVQFL